ncbi:monosaccharide transporter [Lipomyces orientalis]|uniref:Monosaccharide transporter n=1 Tax=Lipomyces orientalis TaxID=1233043 RepID=A0ACC3TF03_9ASCO
MFAKMFVLIKNALYQDLNLHLILIGLISSVGALGFGFDNGWWGGALGLSEFKKKYGDLRYPSRKASVGTGTGSAGIILGCIIAPLVTSRIGRKKAFLVTSLLMSAGIVLEVSALTSFWQLVVGRIIVYSGIGLASNFVPMYLSECAPPRIRGAFLALYSFFTSLGTFLASVVVYLSQTRHDRWQYLIVILLVAQEVLLLKDQVEDQRELHKASSISDCFKGSNLRRTVIAMSVQILQQAQGVSFIQNFIVTFMQQLGFPNALRTNVMVTGCSFAVHVVTFLKIDKVGRRRSLFLGALGLAVTMLGTGAATATGSTAAAFLILWYYIYGFTWGPGCWVVAAEVGTGQLRERTHFLVSMGSFLTSIPINFANPYVQANLGGSVTFIYGGFSVVAVIWVLIMIPETRGRSLEELDEMFQADVKTRQFKDYQCTGIGAHITHLDEKGVEVVEQE